MRRILQGTLGLGGLASIGIALMLIALGSEAIWGAGPVNATLDSEIRFYAAVFGGYGAAVLWCVKDVERKGRCVRFIAAILFAGGLARGVSVLVVGFPHPFFVAMLGVELALPPLVVLMQSRIERGSLHRQAPIAAL